MDKVNSASPALLGRVTSNLSTVLNDLIFMELSLRDVDSSLHIRFMMAPVWEKDEIQKLIVRTAQMRDSVERDLQAVKTAFSAARDLANEGSGLALVIDGEPGSASATAPATGTSRKTEEAA